MARTKWLDKGFLLFFVGLGLLSAIAGIVLFSAVQENQANLGALENSGKAFLKALGSGEGDEACALMTRTARSELAAAQRKDTCPQAVEAFTGALSDAERDELAGSYASRFFPRNGSLGHVNVDDNPLQISELMLSEVDGKWLVAEWH
ncbi:hypothetical protein [Streptomyces parvus]|uniref:DUF4878 domain-containing protein n=1 Tax=Streptomyces parvus TaxID=66428 RepID=A0A7K3RPX3_9ACTN|nr:hypothetical protein [Streptomyces parvus]NEC17231.1 hypothetical protein [Streptomyces parvus]